MGLSGEALLAILYDLSQAAAGEMRSGPLLQRVLQRLLYHTSFPVGLILRHTSPEGPDAPVVEIGQSIGDRALVRQVGAQVTLAPGALAGRIQLHAPSPLAAQLGARRSLQICLELPVDPTTTLLLFSPDAPHTPLPWTAVFEPAMANLGRALRLATENERLAAELRHELQVRTQAEQAAREAKEQAEAANRAKSRFLANMSHEIRTPMNAILGFTHLLERETADPRQIDKLHKIGAAAEHLLGLLNDVLDLSKIEAGRLELEEGRIDLGAAFDHVVSMVTVRARENNVSISQEIDPTLALVPMSGDPMRLKQVLLNLVTNAVKFTTHGEVRLQARLVDADADSARIQIDVTDTGVGIPPDVLPRLFSSFEQGRPETARSYGGTGLGLAICKRLVQLMGGEIHVESTPGAGSRFWFTARLTRASAPAGLPALPALGVQRSARVLLVDDNPINRDMAVELLQSFGLEVSAADGGPAAIEVFGEGGIQLVLLDKEMPGMDGPATARALRALPGGHVPILAWTANTFEFDRRQCLAAGMDDFIPKPIEPRLLHDILAKWIPAQVEAAPAPWAAPAPSTADITCTGGWTPSVLALDTAIAVLGGSRERAVHYLGRFPHDHRGDLAQIVRLSAEGDLPAAARAAKELSGVAVGLGLEALARASGRLAAALQQPAVEAALTALAAAVDQAMNDALQAIHDVIEASGHGAPLHTSVEAALDHLDALLEADDAQAVEVWTQVRAPLAAWVGAAPVEPIASAIDRFDLAGARLQLAGLRRR